jgi:predicted secreted hydrolase
MHKLHSMSVSLLAVALYASPARSYEAAAPICPSGLSGPINLPADDSVHPYSQYSDEWWYYSSHLTIDDGRELGFVQIVYTSLDPSSGAPIQYVDATISDTKTGEYHFGGRQFAYSAATYVPDGFEFAIGTERVRGGNGHDVVHSEVADGSPSTYVVDLSLVSEKTPVLHLADGYINYYSRERMLAEGTVVIDGEVHRAFGTTWFDHQFGPQLVELSTVQNWTWIAAQLGGSRELLALVVDKQDGTQELIGSYTDADCTTTQLGAGDFTQTALGSWTESSTCTYPFGWRVTVPSKGIDVQVWPTIQNQDIWIPGMDRYYEGDSVVIGTDPGRAYVELYGFCAP